MTVHDSVEAPAVREITIFVSSPSDVMAERERVGIVLERLNGELAGAVRFRAVRWEQRYYTADKTFQAQIVPPEATDIVVCILWKRLGTELPPEYRRSDGSLYGSGTEYEYETALEAKNRKGTPDLLVYRKTAKVLFDAEAALAQEQAQYEALKAFCRRWFHDAEGRFTAGFNPFDSPDSFETLLDEHLRQWLADNGVAMEDRVTWPACKGSPFRGLEPFEAEHAAVFFGRRRAVEKARECLAGAETKGCPFLLVLGGSGSGKSSLARAGLVPRVTAPGVIAAVDQWRSTVFPPAGGGDVLSRFAARLSAADVLPEVLAGDYRADGELADLWRRDPAGGALPVVRAVERWAEACRAAGGYDRPYQARLLLVIDQFEEVFALPEADRAAFATLLAGLAESRLVWVVATLRSDFYAAFQADATLARLKEGGAQFDLAPPGEAELGEIIRGPARAAGLRYERTDDRDLDAVLEQAARAPGALPLLEFTLDQLFRSALRDGDVLTFAAYEALGGLEGAIERRAGDAFEPLADAVKAQLPGVLRRLLTVSEGTATARTATLDQVATTPERRELVDAFVAARLLTVGGDDDGATLRFAHEALIRNWQRARDLIATDIDFLKRRARAEAAHAEWLARDRRDDFLLPDGLPLAEAEAALRSHGDELDEEVTAYIRQSAKTHRRRRTRRQRIAAGVAAGMTALAAAAGLFGWEAERQRSRAERTLAAATETANGVVINLVRKLREQISVPNNVVSSIINQGIEAQNTIAALGEVPDTLSFGRGVAFSERAIALRTSLDIYGARRAAEESVAILKTLADAVPNDNDIKSELGSTYSLLGELAFFAGDPDAGFAYLDQSVKVMTPLAEIDGASIKNLCKLSMSYNKLGNMTSANIWKMLTSAFDNISASDNRDAGVALSRDDGSLKYYELAEKYANKARDVDINGANSFECLAESNFNIGNYYLNTNPQIAVERFDVLTKLFEAHLDVNSPKYLRSTGILNSYRGILLTNSGKLDEGRDLSRRGLDLLERGVHSDSGDLFSMLRILAIYEKVGESQPKAGTEFTRTIYDRIGTICDKLMSDAQSVPLIMMFVGGALDSAGRFASKYDIDKSRLHFKRAVEAFSISVKDGKQSWQTVYVVSAKIDRIAESVRGSSLDDAMSYFDIALGILKKNSDERRNTLIYHGYIAELLIKLAHCARDKHDANFEIEYYKKAQISLDTAFSLLEGNKPKLKYELNRDLAALYVGFGDAFARLSQIADARGYYELALPVRERLANENPGNIPLRRALGILYIKLGDAARQSQDIPSAMRYYNEGINIREVLFKIDPRNYKDGIDLANSLKQSADILFVRNEWPASSAIYSRSIEVRKMLTKIKPWDIDNDKQIAQLLIILGKASISMYRAHDAMKYYDEALSLLDTRAIFLPRDADLQSVIAYCGDVLGELAAAEGSISTSISYYEKARGATARLVELHPDDMNARNRLATIFFQIGDKRLEENRYRDAAENYLSAIKTVESAMSADQGNGAFRYEFTSRYRKLIEFCDSYGVFSDSLEMSRRWADAERRYGKNDADFATALGIHSYYLVFSKDFTGAKADAEEGFRRDRGQIWILTNLAHAEMFLGNAEASLALHRAHRADKIGENKTWADAVRDDFAKLRQAGLDHPLMPEIERILAEPAAGTENAHP